MLLTAALLAACGASEPTSSEAAAAETAATVCGMLRDWSNEMAASMNATSDAITDDDDPATAGDVLVEGYDELIALAEEHVAEVDELDLPATDARAGLLDELRTGAEQAVDELTDQRAEALDLPPITVSRQAGALGGAHTGLEKAQSVVEPRISAYDDPTLSAAFAAEPTCRHVVQDL